MLSTVFEKDRVVSRTQENFRARDAVECCNVLLSAGNNPGLLRNSTEDTEPLFITFGQFSTRLPTSDWFLAMLKISPEHGSGSSANEKLCLGNSKQH